MTKLPLFGLDFTKPGFDGKNHPLLHKTDRNPHFVCLGEISSMPDHVVVIRMVDQKIFSGWHMDNFVVLARDNH